MRFFLLSVFFLMACAQNKGDDVVVNHKSVFSVWVRDDQALTFNFSSGSFGNAFLTQLTTSGGQRCNCNITMLGDENSGNYTLASCTYVTGTGNGVDPGCASLNQVGTFTRVDPNLKVCTNGTTCATYR